MTDFLNDVYSSIDEEHRDKPASTRRQIVAGAAATLGSMGMLGVAQRAYAQGGNPNQDGATENDAPNTIENIVNVAATAEVLATIVNTVGAERTPGLPARVKRNIEAAARHEVIHYETLISDAVGAKAATKRIWVPDSVFSSAENLLKTLVVGDQVFINAYLLGGTVFARAGGLRGSRFARFAAEFMGVEAVHRAAALDALGQITGNDAYYANDRAFMKFAQREGTPGILTTGLPGFYTIDEAVKRLQSAGFGFGEQGKGPGAFYDYDEVSKRTPNPGFVRTVDLS